MATIFKEMSLKIMKKRRPLNEIMYKEKSVDVVFIQPHLLRRQLKSEQNQIVQDFWNTMHQYTVLLGDIPTEPNHGIFYMAASLLKANRSVEVLDFHALDRVLRENENRMVDENDIVRAIRCNKARVFGISSKTVAIKRGIRIAEIIKKYYPESLVVFGGLHPTLNGKELIQSSKDIDFVVRGDGEQAIIDILNYLDKKISIEDINGLLYRSKDGGLIENKRIPVNKVDLDSLPFPAYELICKEANPLVPRILSARGCPHDCVFCSINFYYDRKIGFRDPIKVVDEVEYMAENFGIDFYCLGDLTFMVNKKYGEIICNEIIKRGLSHIKWWCQTTVGRLNRDQVELMKKAGCVQVAFGIEGGTQEILDLNDKPSHFKNAEEQCRIIKDAGLSVQTYWLIGMGGETFKSALNRVEEIKYFIRNNLSDATHISIACPFPGTPIWHKPEKYGYNILHKDYDRYWMNCDELGYDKPALKTDELSSDHLYMFWLLALSTATKEFQKIYGDKSGIQHFIPKGMFENRQFDKKNSDSKVSTAA